MRTAIEIVKAKKVDRGLYNGHIYSLVKVLSGSKTVRPGLCFREREVFENENCSSFFAHAEGRVVAMASIFYVPHYSQIDSYVHDVVCLPEFRGWGIGNELMNHLFLDSVSFASTAEQNIQVTLTSGDLREAAHALYEKHGFELVSNSINGEGTNMFRKIVAPP